jgi:hypothetical protein
MHSGCSQISDKQGIRAGLPSFVKPLMVLNFLMKNRKLMKGERL